MQAAGLKVLLIGPYPLQEGKVVGGVEAVTNALAPALSAHDEVAHVTVLCFHHEDASVHQKKLSDKLQILYLPGQNHFSVITRTIVEVMRARRVTAQFQPDIVHGQGIGSRGEVAIQLGSTPVVTVHGLVHLESRLADGRTLPGRLRAQLVEARMKRILRQARVVISISDYDARALTGLVRGHHKSIPNPISPEFFSEPSYDAAGPRILFAGVMTRRKNLEGLLNAFALTRKAVPNARLIIVGPTPDREYTDQIHKHVRGLDLTDAVEFLGHVENDQLLQEIRACRALTLFSHEETLPTILAQAMAAGKPLVASRVGGIPEMICDQENGFLVDAGDEQGLADRLTILLKSPELARKMGMYGHQLARQRYEPSAVAHQTVMAYHLARQNQRA